MTDQINILYYSSTERIVSELNERLKFGNRNPLLIKLGDNRPLASGKIEKGVYVNAIILQQGDMENLRKVDWETIPQLNTISNDKGVFVSFCVNCQEIPAQLYDFCIVKEVKDSAEEIRTELMQLYGIIYQKIKGRYVEFVGRNSEIEQFQNLLYSGKASHTNVFVLSGRPGVGREAFVRECIRQDNGIREYEPFTLSVGRNSNIELFLIQLNSVWRYFSEEEFRRILSDETEEKVKVAVDMLNSLFSTGKYLVLYDDGASCVRYNRELSEWFREIINSPRLMGGMHLYVISNISVSNTRIKTEENAAFFTLYVMTLSDRRKLLYKKLSSLETSVAEEDVQMLAEQLSFSPSQLLKVAEEIKKSSWPQVKKNIKKYQIEGDSRIMSIVKKYNSSEHPEAWDLLILLSKIEYVGEKILTALYADSMLEIDKEIDAFMSDGILERFGEWMNFIKLDSAVSDYLRRNKYQYSKKSNQEYINDTLSSLVEGQELLTEDYSTFLYKIKTATHNYKFTEESFLVPSVLVNTISETYDNKDWKMAIKLCEDVLNRNPNYFQEVYREIRYWYCLSLARVKDRDKFYEQVKFFNGADLHFLKGFFYRVMKQYNAAEIEYKKALDINPSMSRARREMVLVLQAQQKFSSALELAKKNYEKDPENAYHVHAYFRCLVRKRDITHEDRNTLERIINSDDMMFKSQFYKDGMRFEYDRFVNRLKPDVLLPRASELINKYKDAKYIKDIVTEYRVSQGIEERNIPDDVSSDFNF